MKTVTKNLNFDKVVSLPKQKDFKPLKPSLFWRCLIRIISIPGLLSCRFTYKKIGMEKLNKKELRSLGVNDSIEHVDFMIGTPDMTVTGIQKDGTKIQLFVDGEWVI